jgi:hypothetical protein
VYQRREGNLKLYESLNLQRILLPFMLSGVEIYSSAMHFFHYFKTEILLVTFMLMSGFNPISADEPKPPINVEKPPVKAADVKPQADVKTAEITETVEEVKEVDPDDEVATEEADAAAVAKPVTSELVQVFGWREKILVEGMKQTLNAKLDSGAFTSSIHAEEKELFERDGKKWVKFIVTDPHIKDSPRVRLEAPLVRIARIKNPGSKSETREVVKLSFKIGERKMRGDFTLNNRSNMLAPVLIGRTVIKELGWVDPTRTNIANDKIMR